MGYLVNGEWILDDWVHKGFSAGQPKIQPTLFRSSITRDGSSGFSADADRYHLYIAYACPWAHRTHLVLKLKSLESKLTFSIVDPVLRDEEGWIFSDYPGSTPDPINNFTHLRQIYLKSDPQTTGRVTVPVLFDKQTQKIVNNESAEIIKMLNESFDGPDLYPEELREKIDEINQWVFSDINSGVYKCGFTNDQEAYEKNVVALFSALDKVEEILDKSRYLAGDVLTLADVRLFPTLVRFDSVYYGHFKCNLRMLKDYENIWNYVKEIYQMPGIPETVNFDHVKRAYYMSQAHINPSRVVPKGPVLNFMEPHNRASKFSH